MLSTDAFFDEQAMRALVHTQFGGADFGECRVTMQRVPPGDSAAWHREWTATADRVAARVSRDQPRLRRSPRAQATTARCWRARSERSMTGRQDAEAEIQRLGAAQAWYRRAMPKAFRLLVLALGSYLALVVAFESLVGVMGQRQANRGVQPGEGWLVITTTDGDGSMKNAVVAGVESEGQLYVSANHWPRGWYDRAVANPDVAIALEGETSVRRAVPVSGEERDRIARDSGLPWAIRFLTGFPPRSFLRLDPR